MSRVYKRKFASLGDDEPLSRAMMPLKARRKSSQKGLRPPKAGASLLRQMRSLIQSKKKDAPDVTRINGTMAGTTVSCLTSSTTVATAASGTGLLDMDGDSALINWVRIRANILNECLEDVTPVGIADALVRHIVVWYHKPLLVASAAGTLPPVTEILMTDDLRSLYVPSNRNAGRYVVLSDKTWNFGQNTVAVAATGAYPRFNGVCARQLDYVVKVNKNCHFMGNAVSGTPAGHYDSDVVAGQIDTGLLCFYTMTVGANASGTLTSVTHTRLNYTG